MSSVGIMNLKTLVDSPAVRYYEDYITSTYSYTKNRIKTIKQGQYVVHPEENSLEIRTERKRNSVGVLLVGWGGNNGSTFTAALTANREGINWETKKGTQTPNWFGSITQSSVINIGTNEDGVDVNVLLEDVLPMASPDEIVVDGWDLSSVDLGRAMKRAQVLDSDLQQNLFPIMSSYKPRPSIYKCFFIAENQEDRIDNSLPGTDYENLETIRKDIREMKERVDHVVVIWTASTECFCLAQEGIHDTPENLLNAIKNNHPQVSPSTIFAVAAILEKCTYINGSPQNTFVPAVRALALDKGTFLGGDDFKSGQTKVKSVLVDFFISAGIKPVSIVSYNHLGNNDGKNLSSPEQFLSKKISKTNMIDDIVSSNHRLYHPDEKVDHTVVIKYVPYVGDSKRAMDEYTSEILCGGINTMIIHNTCEDSLLAAPIILDLIILSEFASRVSFRQDHTSKFVKFKPELSFLSYMFKSPLIPEDSTVMNALSNQRSCLMNILRACVGLPPEHFMGLETKLPQHIFKKKHNLFQNFAM